MGTPQGLGRFRGGVLKYHYIYGSKGSPMMRRSF